MFRPGSPLRSCTIASIASVCTAPGKTFALGLFAGENRNGQMIADKAFVKIENQFRLLRALQLPVS